MAILILRSSGAASGGGGDSLTHGEVATAEGAGFGAVATPTTVYDDFSGGTLGAQIGGTSAIVGSWPGTGAGNNNAFRSTAETRGVHSRVAFCDLENNSVAAVRHHADFEGDWYIDWWQQINRAPTNNTPRGTRSYKPFRFYSTENTSAGNNFTYNMFPITNENAQFTTWWDGEPPVETNYVGSNWTEGVWAHFRLRFRIGPTYATDVVVFEAYWTPSSSRNVLWNDRWRYNSSQTMIPIEFQLGAY